MPRKIGIVMPPDHELTSLVVTEEDTAQISACLQRLMADTGASYIMVIDRAGQTLAWESDVARPEMAHLGALLAATYASTQEMARILKEDSFRTLLQEGMREKIITETVREQWLLVVIFDHQAQLGLVKVLTKRTTYTLSNILDVVLKRSRRGAAIVNRQVLRATTDTIDLLFNDDKPQSSEPDDEKK